MDEDRVKCSLCGSSYNKMFLMGKQGNVDTCPMCGGNLEVEDEHADWITWWYYRNKKYDSRTLWYEQPLHLEDYELIKEFKAPPESKFDIEIAKKILRTYIPSAFAEVPQSDQTICCPYCHSTQIQMVPRKYSLLTGFATNQVDRVCVQCGRTF